MVDQPTASTQVVDDDGTVNISAAQDIVLEGHTGTSKVPSFTVIRSVSVGTTTVDWALGGMDAGHRGTPPSSPAEIASTAKTPRPSGPGRSADLRARPGASAGVHVSRRVELQASGYAQPFSLWNAQIFLYAAGGTLAVIIGGSLFKTWHNSPAVAVPWLNLSAEDCLIPHANDPHERKLLNVVEEIAIASGASVPKVYVMDHEEGINALAAGHNINDAAIGVTRGCITTPAGR